MPAKYRFERITHKKSTARTYKKKLVKQGYKVRIVDEKLRDGSRQYVIYRSRKKC